MIGIFTNFFERVYKKHCADLIHVDSTSSVDRYNLPLFVFSVATPYGGLPIFALILSDETTQTLIQAFEGMKNFGIKLSKVMTDDCTSLKSAISAVWPHCLQFLCTWHFEQAFWTWLIDGRKVPVEKRQEAINDISKLIFEKNLNEFDKKYSSLLDKYKENSKISKRLEKDKLRAAEWAHSYRGNLIML